MTPSEVLDAVKARFVVLYHKDPNTLAALLRQALGKFQDKAGVILQTRIGEGTSIPLPANFLDVAVLHDSRRNYVHFDMDYTDPDAPRIVIEVEKATVYPVTVHYFADLRAWPDDAHLPQGCVGLVSDYLQALIEVPNTERQRGALLAMGQQATDLPGPQELRERVLTIEAMMEDNQAMLPPVAVF